MKMCKKGVCDYMDGRLRPLPKLEVFAPTPIWSPILVHPTPVICGTLPVRGLNLNLCFHCYCE